MLQILGKSSCQQPNCKWRSGDMHFVYPGEQGPLDSIRSEMLRKGAQDCECLWMIRELLAPLSDDGCTAGDHKSRRVEGSGTPGQWSAAVQTL